MGIILSRFRKKKTTIEILEDLDSQIKEIQQYGQTTEQRHKKIVGTIIIYGVVLYVMIAFIFYFCFFPASLYDQLFYIIPLLFFPILILLTKKMISWYYNRKITHNQEKLSTIMEEKKKILNEVTETETYKKAKEILLKFAPDELNMSPFAPKLLVSSETPRRSVPQIATPLPSGDLRRRVLSTQNQSQSGQTSVSGAATPAGSSKQPSNTLYQFNSRVISPVPSVGFRSPLPRPVLSQQRTVIDRLVDYLVGDGPSNRYALICRQCESHNGMALKEEFEYFAYRCCYCGFWNPARKQKPSAPKLDIDNSSFITTSNMSELLSCNPEEESVKHTESETCTQSDTDSDIEVVERPGEISETAEPEVKQLLDENESEKTET
ncbi:endoplasmic reticulum junction formation protein lunapark-B isoform X2 [Odontomachus brunneus]|uniref:endoplasmic reticulum junction formation protein lunapark-B isoform X2 n=1 Tax=Odontomachus brunneus TaxID=486640 RepID=UPI0013F1AA39|nr:endoplasmic reticulum junction formation protein lunapark-B isoform X2 [Odontomachus brunneus]